MKLDTGSTKGKGGLLPNGSEVQAVLPPSIGQPGTTSSVEHQTRLYESNSRQSEDIISRDAAKTSVETEGRGVKSSAPSGSVPKQDLVKDDGKHTKSLGIGITSSLAKGRPLDSGAEIKSETVISKASDSRTSIGKGDSVENFDGPKQSRGLDVGLP